MEVLIVRVGDTPSNEPAYGVSFLFRRAIDGSDNLTIFSSSVARSCLFIQCEPSNQTRRVVRENDGTCIYMVISCSTESVNDRRT